VQFVIRRTDVFRPPGHRDASAHRPTKPGAGSQFPAREIAGSEAAGVLTECHGTRAAPPVVHATAKPGFYPNPDGSGDLRFFDGDGWTDRVKRRQVREPSERLARNVPANLGRLATGGRCD